MAEPRSGGAESGLVLPVTAATPAVAPWRERLDPAAIHGVPAHVTVLYPFVPQTGITGTTLGRLTALFAAVPPFEFVLDRIGWFDERVVYLAPEPEAPFVALTRRVMQAFPGYEPYGGAFADIKPHLTIGDHGTPEELRRAAAAVAPALPIAARATEVWLMVATDPSDAVAAWRVYARFPLGGRAGETGAGAARHRR